LNFHNNNKENMSEFYAIFSIMFDEETSYNKNGPGNVIFGGEVSRFLHTF